MKTSKRLLSLFLAAVMVITTCSVGFAAFAADPEDEVFTYVTDEGEAVELTYSGLNDLVDTYAPMLIEALRGILEGIEGANIDVDAILASETPIFELLAQLSPWLIGLIGGSSSADDVLGASLFNDIRYGYLNNDDQGMSFWSLYTFCKDHSDDSDKAVRDFCVETLAALQTLLDAYSDTEKAIDASLATIDNAMQTLLGSRGFALFYYDGTNRHYAISYNDTSDPYYDAAYTTVTNSGIFSSLPASRETIGKVLLVDNQTTLADFAAQVEANGNVYNNGTPSNTSDDIDFNLFIDYVSFYAQKGFIINEGEKLSLLDALYYYYNLELTKDSRHIIAAAYANSDATETISFDQHNYNEGLLPSIANVTNIDVSPKAFWFDSLLEDYPFSSSFANTTGGMMFGCTKENYYLYDGLYEGFLLYFSVTMLPGDGDSYKYDWYSESMAYLMTELGIFDSIDSVKADAEQSLMDDTEWQQLQDIANENGIVGTQPDTVTKYQSLVQNSDVITNVVLKDRATSIDGSVLSDIRRWTPGSELTANLKTFAALVDSNYYCYYANRVFNGTSGDSKNISYSETAAELYKSQFIASRVTASYNYADYAPDSDIAIKIVNSLINGYINQYLGEDAPPLFSMKGFELYISDILENLLTTNVDLVSALSDIYLRLANDPVKTLFELVPLLIILIDEVIIPLLLNTPGDVYNGVANILVPALDNLLSTKVSQSGGSDIGIGQLCWDLNELVPALLHWLTGDNSYTYTYYNRTDNGDGTFTYNETTSGALGTKYDDAGEPTGLVPVIFNIYYVDSQLAGASLKDLADAAVKETATTLVSFATEAVDEYVAEHGSDIKSYNFGDKTTTKGLNNLLVSIPMIIDIMGTKFLDKYNVDSDWTFGEFDVDGDGCTYNVSVQQFKDLADGGAAEDILATFVDMFVNNWFNAITDILNDLVSDTENDITSNIPIVTALLNSVDLFGEKSVLTDILNGLFLITREHPDSFTFETQENGYVGIGTLNAYFLLINLNTIIEVITDIVDANQSGDDTQEGDDTNSISLYADGDDASGGGLDLGAILTPVIDSLSNNVGPITSDSENLEGAAGLIDSLDSLLSALLSNAYMNGYQLDEVDGILSGVVTFITNAFGENQADQLFYVLTEYLKVLNAGSSNEDGSANKDANGPVDAKKVYTKENLSNIVTQTYVLIESLINDNLVIAGDYNKLIPSAVNGIISPSAIAVNSDEIDSGIMQYFSWSEVSATGYAKDLGYSFKNGDKEGFYESLIDSLGVIPSILGVLLVDTGLYDNVVSPLLGEICKAMEVSYTDALPADATGEDAVYAVIETVSGILGSFLDAPVSGLLSLVRAVLNIIPDAFLKNIIDSALNPIYNEMYGFSAIIANLSPSLSDELDAIVDDGKAQIGSVIPSDNILLTLIGQAVGTDLSGVPLSMILNIIKPYTVSNEKLLLLLYTLLVDLITDETVFGQLIGNQYPWLAKLITSYDSASLLNLLKDIINSIQSTKEISWMFEKNGSSSSFKYPAGISAQDAEDAIDSLDELVANIFPLLKEFGVVDQAGLSELLNGFIFTNSNITELAKAVYGGIESAASGSFVFSPSQFADYLMDSSYGATFSSAAAALRKCSSWSKVGTINWGFTDGSANAQTGFVKALAALTRPVNDVLAAFLAEGDANIASIAARVLNNLAFDETAQSGNTKVRLVYKNSTLTIYIDKTDNPGNKTTTLQVDLASVIDELNNLSIAGGNGYESAIIPLFEALGIDSYVSYDQYLKNCAKAKDSVLTDVLNPIVDFLNDVTAAPFDTLTQALPKLAAFLEDNGLGHIINNLLSPVTALIDVLNKNGINIDDLIEQIAGKSLKDLLEGLIGIDLGNVKLEISDLENSLNIQDILIPLVNTLLKDKGINIKLSDIDWGYLAGLKNQGQVLITVLRYIEDVLIKNSASINSLLGTIDAIKKNATIQNILDSVFGQIATANKDDIVLAVFYLLLGEPTNTFFDYSNFKYKEYDFSYPTTVDIDFLTILGPMLDGLIDGVMAEFLGGNLNSLVETNLYTDSIISSIATGLYGAIEGVKINDSMNLTELLAMTGIDFSTAGVAALLVNDDYGQSYASSAKVIRNAGSWSRVKADSLSWGVKDRDSFVHAVSAVLRPIYGVLDVLLNDGSLGLFNLIYLPGSDGYTSTIVPLLEAFGCYNIKTQYQYREDMSKEYDYILIDILNPILDKVEDLLSAPIQTLADILPNLALFFANDGLLQVIDNLLVPITALLDALKPIADVNDIIAAAGLDIEGELRKLGLVGSNYSFDIYDLSGSLKPLIGSENIVGLLNKVLGMIKVNGAPLGIELMPIDWYQLASHGEVITDEASQASTHGKRIYVDADPNEVLIAVLRYLVETVNYKDNFTVINDLIGGLLGGANDSISGVVNNVLSVLTGETDEVISALCELLQTLA